MFHDYKDYHQIITDEEKNSSSRRKLKYLHILFFCFLSTLVAFALIFNKRTRVEVYNSILTKPGLIRSWEILTFLNETTFISFSRLSNGYKIHIDIFRVCRNNTVPENLGLDESYAFLMKKQRIGPDEIFVQLEGASMQTILAHSEDFCGKYFAMAQVPRSGSYRLKVIRTRTDYQAVKEIAGFPLIQYEVFIDEMLPTYLSHYMPRPCEYNFTKGYWVTNIDRQLAIIPLYRY